jgi:peptidyl-prolyl cis-trans isomerase SurA
MLPALKPLMLSHAVRLAFAILICAAAATVAPAFGQSSIKILVNDKPITSLDVKNRAAMLKAFTRGKQGEKEATDQLIEEALMMQEAARRNIKVSDEEIDAEFGKRATQAGMSATQFGQRCASRASIRRPSRTSCAPTWRGGRSSAPVSAPRSMSRIRT